MAYVTILDFQKGEVIIKAYDDSVNDVEEEVVKTICDHSDYLYMCTSELKLTINPEVE